MKYSLFLYSDESQRANLTAQQIQDEMRLYGAYIGALQQAGVFVTTDWLQPSSTATQVSLRNGRKIQDGPFADTKEQLGGFFVIDVPHLDAAIAWAEKCPAARYGVVEIRASAMPAK
jgi:hypothetical protein